MINGINLATHDLTGNGVAVVGNILLSLDLSVAPDVSEGWFRSPTSPEEEQARLKDISRAIQFSMRKVVPYFYLQDPTKYNLQAAVSALVLYASLPPIANDPLFFDFHDPVKRAGVISAAQPALKSNMQAIADLLAVIPGMGDRATGFVPNGINVNRINNDVTAGIGENNLVSLLNFESDMIKSATDARTEILQFKDVISTNRAQAMQRLAQFSADITKAFNDNVATLYGGANVRPLGTLAFLQTCLATKGPDTFATSLLPDPFAKSGSISLLTSNEVKALLDITVLKPTVTVPDSFFTGDDPDRKDTLLQTRLVNLR